MGGGGGHTQLLIKSQEKFSKFPEKLSLKIRLLRFSFLKESLGTTSGMKCHCNSTTVMSVKVSLEWNINLVYLWTFQELCVCSSGAECHSRSYSWNVSSQVCGFERRELYLRKCLGPVLLDPPPHSLITIFLFSRNLYFRTWRRESRDSFGKVI